ncbi:MAG: DUF5714 domain-containing protein [Coriobacteriaceae bacterium]|nr:DUF5714 domain-containing protein [Coriobacteriaceae bacterium]
MGELTPEERGQRIIGACLAEKSANPYEVFRNVARRDFVRMHGPEHHVLDGAAVLVAYHNAGGDVDLPAALAELASRGLRMPGAMCGLWGVCGATASVGAALSILEGTGPLSGDDSWGSHMAYTSRALEALSHIGGPRCCKRDAYISLETAVDYIRERFGVRLEKDDVRCGFYPKNAQCLGERCPFFPANTTGA